MWAEGALAGFRGVAKRGGLAHSAGLMDLKSDKELVAAQSKRTRDAKRFLQTIAYFDALNDDDRKRVAWGGRDIGYELYFSIQLFSKVLELAPAASEELLLAARSQHICRWMIPREDYPMDRAGYLKWRADLKKFHASKAGGVMEEKGYPPEMVERVRDLNLKKGLKSDPDCQTLEDGLCLVFLEKQFGDFSEKTDEDKMVNILRKTWAKMSEAGHAAALALPMGEREKALVEKALAG